MTRALLLAGLVLPALAAAQQPPSGSVLPLNRSGTVDDKYINIDECAPGNGREIELQWNVALDTGAVARGGVYRFYAANKATPTDATECPKVSDDSLTVGPVGEVTANASTTIGTGFLPSATFVTASGQTCAGGTDRNIYVCVDYHPLEINSNTPATDPTGIATGVLVLSTTSPDAPTLNAVRPGSGRLEADWTPAATGSAVDRYRLVATSPTGTVHAKETTTATTSGEVGGLVNDPPTVYTVTVHALSAAGNPSPASNALTGTPVPGDDFWDRYDDLDGSEQGGCGAPGAGPLALLGLAAALARGFGRRRS